MMPYLDTKIHALMNRKMIRFIRAARDHHYRYHFDLEGFVKLEHVNGKSDRDVFAGGFMPWVQLCNLMDAFIKGVKHVEKLDKI